MADDTGDNKARRRRALWLAGSSVVVLVVLAGAVLSLGAYHRRQRSGAFPAGTCFQVFGETGIATTDGLREVSGRVKVVNCASAHDAEVTRTVHRPSDCAADGAWLETLDQIRCVTFTTTVGHPASPS
ncbi:hypothetical protein FBZ33_6454 [Micromonospora sp. A202]|uniref:hypothetical protein n=1 Tax=Micromonospora sp. A202 TaxID=2572899 RepID=UPI0011511A6E|nr:hypothetical protein [Micromonospora sp. A202]TQJ26074.1 hypothetical protein FBZ33_6454 [Micromonospora sp. A202]